MTRLSITEARRLGLVEDKSRRRAAVAVTDAPPMKESEIQAAIREFLRWRGWFVIKIHQSLGSYRGIADLYALKDGRSLWIEVKTAKGQQTEYQRQFEADIKAHGGEYLVARSVEDVVEYLGEG